MRVASSKLKRFCYKFLLILLIIQIIFSVAPFKEVPNIHTIRSNKIKRSNLDYDKEIELEFGVPIQISEVSVPKGNIFEGYDILGFFLTTNFSNNNGSIWINNQNEELIWRGDLNQTIEIYIDVNESSIRKYSLWANSSTLGNNTLYFTFRPEIFHAGNIGLIVVIISIPIIIIVIIVIEKGRTKESRSVRFAKRIGERMAIKYEDKYQEKVKKIFGDRFQKKGIKFCPNCGIKVRHQLDKFCTECGSELKKKPK